MSCLVFVIDVGKKATDMTLAIALPVGTLSLVMVSAVIGVFLYKRKANREKTPPGTLLLSYISFYYLGKD